MFKFIGIPFFLSAHLYALSLAVYTPLYIGETEVTGESNSNIGYSPQNYEPNLGIGLAYDSSLSNTSFFNYRLGIEYIQLHKEVSTSTTLWAHDKNKLSLLSTFGFSMYKSNTSRFWIGPSFVFSMDTIKESL